MDSEQGNKKWNNDEVLAKKSQSVGYGGVTDRSTWVRIKPSIEALQWAELSFNPVVTIVSLVVILGFAVWAMLLPDSANAEFASWKSWVGNNFTWLYIGSQDVWAVFIIIVYLSKYGSIKLVLRLTQKNSIA